MNKSIASNVSSYLEVNFWIEDKVDLKMNETFDFLISRFANLIENQLINIDIEHL